MGNNSDNPKSESSQLATIASGAGFVFGGRLAKLGLGFSLQVIMARLLGADAYGGVVLATMTMAVGVLIARLGMKSGVMRKLPYHEDDPATARGIVKASVQIAIVSSFVMGSILMVTAPIISTRLFNNPSITPLIRIAAVGIPFSVFMTIGVSTARALRDAKTHVLVNQLLSTGLKVVLIGVLLLAGWGAAGAVMGNVLAMAVSALAALYLSYRALPFSVRGPTIPMRFELLTFSFPLLLASSADYLLAQTDTFLVGMFMAAGDVGAYNVAYRLHSLGMIFFYPVTFLLPPVLTRLMKHDQVQSADRTYKVVTKWMTLLTLPLFLLVFLFPEVVIKSAFGNEYATGATALQILIIPVMVTTILGANGSALVAFGHNHVNLYGNGTVALLNIGLNVLFIPKFGLIGAATATAISFVTRDLFYTALLYYWYDIQPFSRALLQPLIGVALLVAIGYAVFVRFFTSSFLTVACIGLVFLTVYGPLVIRLGAIKPIDIEVINRFEDSTGVQLASARRVVKYFNTRRS
ncbi:flippase [Halostella sp. JP-L12]|uniref:flippase n=1 Tax=Halostella TaxID=1843185 RepID=UPI000EF81EE0|nr:MULTISPECIES: flippase [Halostella]NHN46526.1 flippase [Halostella sp. JP-L12]